MATWEQMRSEDPETAEAGKRLLGANGYGVSFLGTVRLDGGPRMHPVAPVLCDGRLYVFVVNMSPKYQDLLRDGRYAMHALPTSEGGEEFYLTGRATHIEDAAIFKAAQAASDNRLGHTSFEALFELDLSHVLYTQWTDWGTAKTWPHYRRWHAR
jgi:hypothetical protein